MAAAAFAVRAACRSRQAGAATIARRIMVRSRSKSTVTDSSTLESRLDTLLPSPRYSSVAEAFPESERPAYHKGARRCGAMAMKVGMAPLWDEDLGRVACTILHIEDCQVVQVKSLNEEESLMQVGAGKANLRRLKKPQKGHFDKAGVEPKRSLCEFRVTKDAVLPPGTHISAQHFVPGQRVDVRGRSIGKGFQGGMKRWGFAGQGASHGVSKTHRHIGSTGQSQDAGKVFKGKKMPGQMGN